MRIPCCSERSCSYNNCNRNAGLYKIRLQQCSAMPSVPGQLKPAVLGRSQMSTAMVLLKTCMENALNFTNIEFKISLIMLLGSCSYSLHRCVGLQLYFHNNAFSTITQLFRVDIFLCLIWLKNGTDSRLKPYCLHYDSIPFCVTIELFFF